MIRSLRHEALRRGKRRRLDGRGVLLLVLVLVGGALGWTLGGRLFG